METYPRRFKAVITAIEASTKNGIKSLNTYVYERFQFLVFKNVFVHMGYYV